MRSWLQDNLYIENKIQGALRPTGPKNNKIKELVIWGAKT